MLTKIQLAADSSTIDISVSDYNYGPYVLKAATGLDPPDIDVITADKVGHGILFKGRRVPKREIVLRIGINPDYSNVDPVGVLRDALYATLDTLLGGLLEIRFIDDVRGTRIIQAVVEKFESPSSTQEIEAQITFICPDPFITDTADTILTPASSTLNITYDGTADVGFVATLSLGANSGATWVQITKSQTGDSMRFTGSHTGSHLMIMDTRPGLRSVKRSIASVLSNGLHTIGTDYDWMKLTKGLNTFVVTWSTTAATITNFQYRKSYWGV